MNHIKHHTFNLFIEDHMSRRRFSRSILSSTLPILLLLLSFSSLLKAYADPHPHVFMCSSVYMSISLSTPLFTPHTFDLPSTLRALKHPQGTEDGLRYLLSLTKNQLINAHSEMLYRELDLIILNPKRSLTERSWAILVFKRMGIGRESLREIWRRGEQGEELLIARLATQTLRALHRVDLLSGAFTHSDPEIRLNAASIGADPQSLCQLLRDPWPQVRYATIRGLERVSSPEARCLSLSLRDPETYIRERAAHAMGELARASWAHLILNKADQTSPVSPTQTLAQRSSFTRPLLALAGDSSAPLPTREAAIIALGRWRVFHPAHQIIQTHLAKGGIIPLMLAAIRSISISLEEGSRDQKTQAREDERREHLKVLIMILKESPSIRVRLSSVKYLAKYANQGHSKIKKIIERWADKRGGEEGQKMLQSLNSSLADPWNTTRSSSSIPLSIDGSDEVDVPSLSEEDREGL